MPRWPQAPGLEDNIQAALLAWRNGLFKSREACAAAHDVDPNTFRRRLSGKQLDRRLAHTKQMRISPEGESSLVRHVIYLAKSGFPCRYRVIRALATTIMEREYGALPLYTTLNPLGSRWIYRFLLRQEELRVCYVRSLELERALANNNPEKIARFFHEYKAARTLYNIADNYVWNMDETGFSMGLAYGARVVIYQDYRNSFKTVDGSREWVTQIDSICTNGSTIPPFLVFKGKQHTQAMWEEALASVGECTIGLTENGWSNAEVGFEWLKHFERHSKPIGEQPNQPVEMTAPVSEEHHGYRMLIMDGHSSHIGLDFVSFCWQHKIVPICLPSHSTHLIQPLDLVIFSKLKRCYSSKVDEYAKVGITGLNREYFLQILGQIRPEVYTPELVKKSFEAAGILPYNPERVLARCSRQTRPSTPPQPPEITLLSSPLHPRTPTLNQDQLRTSLTLVNNSKTPEEAKAICNKIFSYMRSLQDEVELLHDENTDLRHHTSERKAKKAKKRSVISKQAVLTTEAMHELVAAKKATEEAAIAKKLARRAASDVRHKAQDEQKLQLQQRKDA